MGDYTMTIVATGPKHNFNRVPDGGPYGARLKDDCGEDVRTHPGKDADELFHAFVQQLAGSGHRIVHASFTHGAWE